MTTERWRMIEEIYQAAADLEPVARAGFLEQACGSDCVLRREVEGLLGASGDVDTAIEASIRTEAETLANRASESVVGKRIGLYRVTGIIGAGGMGTVYRALRDDDEFQKEVAIKVVKRGMDFDALLARFRRERQILARLEHPNISRLLDGGVTSEALPYFVMEYVEGTPLTQYCADKPIEERLRLFREVCAAVQYAHQNLIVHRDLKPANILVTKDGIPKLLDFGLAKLLDPEQLPEHTFTMVRMLTPDYASPEQVRGEAITTASDIYSLGAVLYEMASGRRAHCFGSRTTAEMERVVCQTDPPPLAGEMGNIVQMALRKEPVRRYATVEQFSEDIRRHLDGLPVIARPDTIVYRGGKFVRRNKLPVAAAGFAFVALLIGIGVALQQARRSERGRLEAQQYASAVLQTAFEQFRQVPGTLAGRTQLAETSLQYLNKLAAEAPADPQLQLDLAIGYLQVARNQGTIGTPNRVEYEKSLETAHKLRAIAEDLQRRDPGAKVRNALLAVAYKVIGHSHENLGNYREALEWWERTKGPAFAADDESYRRIGYPDVRSQLQSSIAGAHQLLGDHRAALNLLQDSDRRRAASLASTGALDEAARLFRGLLKSRRPDGAYLARIFSWSYPASLAVIEGNPLDLNLGDQRQAQIRLVPVVAEAEQLFNTDPLDMWLAWRLALWQAKLGAVTREADPSKAVAAYARSVQLLAQVLERTPTNLRLKRDIARVHAEGAMPLRNSGQADRARQWLQRALDVEREIGEPASFTRLELGDAFLARRERDKALQQYTEAVPIAEKAIEARPQTMQLRRELADCHERLGAFHQSGGNLPLARDHYSKSLAIWRDWTKHGVSSIYNQRREKAATLAVARCERMLKTSRKP
jgi:tetratricopeptide (TPR) repeat protein